MHKIEIPYLIFEGEKIETPVGLSELLESAWKLDSDCESTSDIVNKFDRKAYKNKDGRWVTKFEVEKESEV